MTFTLTSRQRAIIRSARIIAGPIYLDLHDWEEGEGLAEMGLARFGAVGGPGQSLREFMLTERGLDLPLSN